VGVRVRKLARELAWSSGQVLGMLKALGYGRYRSTEDMVSDSIAAQVRKAARLGKRADPVAPVGGRLARAAEAAPALQPHPMASLVSGVRRQGVAPPTPVPALAVAAPPASASPPVPPPPVAAPPARLVAPPAENPLLGKVEALQREVASLRAELASLREARSDKPSLLDLLNERGLRGADEGERAIAALAVARRLSAALQTLLPTDPARVRRLLDQGLVLVGGPIPPELGVPAVTVAPERADVQSQEDIDRRVRAFGEQLLLHGLRRVRLVGVAPRWHAVLQSALDPRVRMSFTPGGTRDALRATSDSEGVDLVLLWNVQEGPGAAEAYAAGAVPVLRAEGRDVGHLLQAAADGLIELDPDPPRP